MRPTIEDLENALEIPFPASEKLRLEDSRRLTGPGLLWDKPGAIVEVEVHGIPLGEVERVWAHWAQQILKAVDWDSEHCCSRRHEAGLNLAISAPMDQLYSAIFVAQAAWHYSVCELLDCTSEPLNQLLTNLKAVMINEANPQLITLQQAAAKHRVDFLCDDDAISLGHGCGSHTWPIDQLPHPDQVDWAILHDVPVAMVTGTNGKSTCVRLASAIATAADKVAGVTSTDFVRVGQDILDQGDYSGPGGARMLLRDQRLEVAFLEVARGGILRRGLALQRAQAALITNVAADHLGQYGINTVAALTEAKFSVFRTLAEGGVLVLNADDEGLVRHALGLAEEVVHRGITISWFSLTPNNPCITEAQTNHLPCAWLEDHSLWYFDGSSSQLIIDVRDVPITMGGAARYNIQNALGVLCLCFAFALPVESVRRGLTNFHSNPQDNPGRGNEFQVDGARVFVDFAHNPHSISALSETMKRIPARRRILMLGHAGDRSDGEICELTAGACALAPDYVVITEEPDYLRGRNDGDVSEVIRKECLRLGLNETQLKFSANPLLGTECAMNLLQPGDLALLLVHSHRDEVIKLLTRGH
ncbi:MAG: Mur ligase [Halieaceae bacterium]|nr:Mur ligase [Halieaceae bacterium]